MAEVQRDASNFTEARAAAREFQGRTLTNQATGTQATVLRNNLDKMPNGKGVGKLAAQSLTVANLDDR